MDPFEPFTVSLPVRIRPCRAEDLPTLEWWGLFSPHRDLIRQVFERHLRGEAAMLVAEANGVASGQVWIRPDRSRPDPTGVIWAVRVFPTLQNLGLGARLVAAAEHWLRDRLFSHAEMTVRQDNPGARRFYERLGYRIARTVPPARDLPPTGAAVGDHPIDEWLLRKPLGPPAGLRSPAPHTRETSA